MVVSEIVVDANPLLSSLLGGASRNVVFSERVVLYSPQHTLFEVEKYLPRVAERLGCSEMHLFRTFQLLPVIAVQPREYDDERENAVRLIGQRDPDDVDVLALALRMRLPIWTQDRDFEGIEGVAVYGTAELRELVGV